MARVVVHIKDLDQVGSRKPYPYGIPIVADETLLRWAVDKQMVDGKIGVTFFDESDEKAGAEMYASIMKQKEEESKPVKEIQCKICSFIADSNINMARHVAKEHPKEK
jgi:hypothetical protein